MGSGGVSSNGGHSNGVSGSKGEVILVSHTTASPKTSFSRSL